MDEEAMTKDFAERLSKFPEIEKVFMGKREVKVFDNDWKTVKETRIEYDVQIITDFIEEKKWEQVVDIEVEIEKKYPDCYFNFELIEREGEDLEDIVDDDYLGKLVYSS